MLNKEELEPMEPEKAAGGTTFYSADPSANDCSSCESQHTGELKEPAI